MTENSRFKSASGPWKRVKHMPHFLVTFLVLMASSLGAPALVWEGATPSTWATLSGFVSYIQNRPDQDTIQPYFPLFPLTPYSALWVLVRKIFKLLPRPAGFIILLSVSSVTLLILSHHSQTSPFPVQHP